MKKTSGRVTLALLAAVGCLTAGCSFDGEATPETESGVVTTRLAADPGTLDPALATGGGQALSQYLYDPLVHVSPDGEIQSGLAESWEVTPNSATFTLRDDVTCGDGTKLQASDVVANFDRLKAKGTNPPFLSSWLSTDDYTVTGDDGSRQFTITLGNRFSFLLEGIANIGIVCPEGLENVDKLANQSFGTGPFELVRATPDVEYVLKSRDDYTWGRDGASTDVENFPAEMVVKVVKSDATAVNLALRGELNLLVLGSAERARLEKDGDFTNTENQSTGFFIVFNQAPARIAHSDEVRRALAMTVDREKANQVYTGGYGRVLDSLNAASPRVCDSDTAADAIPAYDPAAAAQVLSDAGWSKVNGIWTKDGKPLSVKIVSSEQSTKVWEYLQEGWLNFGIDAELEPVTAAASDERLLEGGDWDLELINIVSNLPSKWRNFLSGPMPPDGLNLGAPNPEYDRLTDKALGMPGASGCPLWDRAERSSFDRVNILPMFAQVSSYFGRGVEFTPTADPNVDPLSLRVTG